MNKGYKKLVLFLLMVLSMQLSYSQEMTTMGKEFWFCFMDNAERVFTGDRHRVIISAKNACTVTISMPTTGWQTTANVVPGVATVVPFSVSQSDNQTSGQVLNKGYRLVASDTVSVYVSTIGLTNYEVANVLPLSTLRDEYMIQSYPSDYWGSSFAIIATEEVDICLSSAATTGAQPGDTVTVLLPSAGQVYQLKSTSVGDFSGTTMKSRDCKPIGVFHGDVCAYIPSHAANATCDHAVEQAVPTSYWGKHFVVQRSTSSFNDRIRITSLSDNCSITRNGNLVTTINRGQTYEYQMSQSNLAEYVETTEPAAVNIFFASTGTAGLGDPSMVTINPIEQMVNEVTFGSFNTQSTTIHRVNVAVKTEDRSLLMLDGSVVSQTLFTVLPGNHQYSYATLTVSAGSHTLKMNGGSGFVAYAFGMGNHESYAYSIGSSMRVLMNSLYVNGVEVFAGSQVNICEGTPINLNVRYYEVPNYVVWNYGDGNFDVADSVLKTYPEYGEYQLQTILYYSTNGCYGSNDTLSVNLRVFAVDTTNIDTLVCRNPFVWHGDSITTAGMYDHVLVNQHGCDSLLRLNIDFWSIPTTEKKYEGCDSIVVDGIAYKVDMMVSDTIVTAEGCDSIVNVTYTIHPSYYRNEHYDMDEGDTMTWIDGGRYWSDEQHPTMVLRTVHGCDSIVSLQLNIIPHVAPPPQDSSAIWIPSAFTPDEETNSMFKVESNDIIDMRVSIFTRWGLFVTEFDGLTEDWDGTYKGTKCKQDVYVYLVEYHTKTMPAIAQKRIGTVMLLR